MRIQAPQAFRLLDLGPPQHNLLLQLLLAIVLKLNQDLEPSFLLILELPTSIFSGQLETQF